MQTLSHPKPSLSPTYYISLLIVRATIKKGDDITAWSTIIGHLIEQRCDGIVAAVEDQQQRRNLRLPEVKQLVLLRDDLLTDRSLHVRGKH